MKVSRLSKTAGNLKQGMIVLSASQDEWKKMCFEGDAYLINQEHLKTIQANTENYSTQELAFFRRLDSQLDRDLWIYDLYLTKAKNTPFLVVCQGSE